MKIHELAQDGGSVVCLAPTDTALEAAKLMAKHGVGSVLVTDKEGAIAGIFTERDLMVKVVAAGASPDATKLETVMTADVFTATPDQLVKDLRRDMRARHIRHVPVLENGKVLTVLSMRDLVRADLVEVRRDAEAMAAYIRGEGEGP